MEDKARYERECAETGYDPEAEKEEKKPQQSPCGMCGTALNRGEYITCGECDENFYRDVEKEKEKEKRNFYCTSLDVRGQTSRPRRES